MNQIESATKTYADKRAVLSERVQALEADYAAARRRHLRGIKQSVAATNDARDRLAATLDNGLPQDTTIHWHGLRLPNAMDGVPGLTQDAVKPGKT
ncbi:multicopper oxidase domain-containing protein, partial [Algiphilus sp.]|uniref:multicopper oxidase domain-containing protein n=1 Tax=Algiphilus sp. TaxID=1872431 RepID=UPI003C56AB37